MDSNLCRNGKARERGGRRVKMEGASASGQADGDAPRPGLRQVGAVLSLDLATNVAAGLVGIGGSPGESVFVKAGASTVEPVTP